MLCLSYAEFHTWTPIRLDASADKKIIIILSNWNGNFAKLKWGWHVISLLFLVSPFRFLGTPCQYFGSDLHIYYNDPHRCFQIVLVLLSHRIKPIWLVAVIVWRESFDMHMLILMMWKRAGLNDDNNYCLVTPFRKANYNKYPVPLFASLFVANHLR